VQNVSERHVKIFQRLAAAIRRGGPSERPPAAQIDRRRCCFQPLRQAVGHFASIRLLSGNHGLIIALTGYRIGYILKFIFQVKAKYCRKTSENSGKIYKNSIF
jgi:hypothetical protein